MRRMMLGIVMVLLLTSQPAVVSGRESPQGALAEDLLETWERLQQSLQQWGERMRDRFAARGSREEQPLISEMLENKDQLGLSSRQIQKLEQIRDSFQRQAIRNDANLRIVELDIAALLEKEHVELAKVEVKVREAEKLRGDIRIARLRAIEQAKAQLNPEQKKKLEELLAEPSWRLPTPSGENPPAKERELPSR